MARINLNGFEATQYFGYSHTVMHVLMQTGHNFDKDSESYISLSDAWQCAIEKALKSGVIKTIPDNKSVIELMLRDDRAMVHTTLYIGQFDYNISIGFGVRKW